MIVECQHAGHAPGECEDCLVAAVHGLPPVSHGAVPDSDDRPEWILEAPAEFTAEEIEALAVLADAGLVPGLGEGFAPVRGAATVAEGEPAGADPERPVDFWPVGWPWAAPLRSAG